MKKLIRLSILVALYVAMFILAYSIVPFIVWLFGGEFTAVSKDGIYCFWAVLFINVALGVQFYHAFDSNYFPKNK